MLFLQYAAPLVVSVLHSPRHVPQLRVDWQTTKKKTKKNKFFRWGDLEETSSLFSREFGERKNECRKEKISNWILYLDFRSFTSFLLSNPSLLTLLPFLDLSLPLLPSLSQHIDEHQEIIQSLKTWSENHSSLDIILKIFELPLNKLRSQDQFPFLNSSFDLIIIAHYAEV